MTNEPAIGYLESPEYEHLERPPGIRGSLIGLRAKGYLTIDQLLRMKERPPLLTRSMFRPSDQDQHADFLCDLTENLCSGDGFRWEPDDPVARFP